MKRAQISGDQENRETTTNRNIPRTSKQRKTTPNQSTHRVPGRQAGAPAWPRGHQRGGRGGQPHVYGRRDSAGGPGGRDKKCGTLFNNLGKILSETPMTQGPLVIGNSTINQVAHVSRKHFEVFDGDSTQQCQQEIGVGAV